MESNLGDMSVVNGKEGGVTFDDYNVEGLVTSRRRRIRNDVFGEGGTLVAYRFIELDESESGDGQFTDDSETSANALS